MRLAGIDPARKRACHQVRATSRSSILSLRPTRHRFSPGWSRTGRFALIGSTELRLHEARVLDALVPSRLADLERLLAGIRRPVLRLGGRSPRR